MAALSLKLSQQLLDSEHFIRRPSDEKLVYLIDVLLPKVEHIDLRSIHAMLPEQLSAKTFRKDIKSMPVTLKTYRQTNC